MLNFWKPTKSKILLFVILEISFLAFLILNKISSSPYHDNSMAYLILGLLGISDQFLELSLFFPMFMLKTYYLSIDYGDYSVFIPNGAIIYYLVGSFYRYVVVCIFVWLFGKLFHRN